MPGLDATGRVRRQYDAYAPRYDRETRWYERVMLGDGRAWACGQARGLVLEVAVGTGLNLACYPTGVRLVGVDISPAMLAVAQRRARGMGVDVALVEGDAQRLPFADHVFDTVVCTLGLSSIPDDGAAIVEMARVLTAGGRLVLLGHVASPYRAVRAAQRLVERVGARRAADAQTRQVLPLLHGTGLAVIHRERRRAGVVERVTAAKPR